MRRAAKVTAVLGAVLLAVGCSDSEQPDPLAPEVSASATATTEQDTEKAALDELTRLVALAMNDQGLRQRVKNDMRESRHTTEHKLPFTDYLHGNSGGVLLAKMAKESGKSRDEILALLAQVRPLEFYMPVPEHRESWMGGSTLLVASLLEDHTVPIGYTLRGEPVTLDAEGAPATPTLAIVPVETDFSESLDPAKFKNENDHGGASIGTYRQGEGPIGLSDYQEPICPQPQGIGDATTTCGGGGGGGTSKPGGLYMTYSYVRDYKEAWTKGAPEIEVHIHGPNSGDQTRGEDLACAGEKSTETFRTFNQDGNTWSGEVLLFTQAQINDYNSKYGGGFNVMMWEDDDGACQIKTDKNITQLLQLIAGTAGATAVIVEKPTATSSWIKAGGLFIAAVYSSASWLLSNDDFLGDAPQVGTNVARTDLWLDGSTTNGYIITATKYMQ